MVETTHRKVTWDDFKGKAKTPGSARWDDGSWAHLTSAMVIESTRIVPRQAEDGSWIAELSRSPQVYAVMDKDMSGAAPGANSPELLAHEQLHFDITEAFARRLTIQIASLVGQGSTAPSAVEDLQQKLQSRYDAQARELLAYQNSYDSETRHGIRRKAQKKWSQKVGELFANATAELEQARAEGVSSDS
ncbi:MAG: DUF922 domain-containing protein [Acidobacteriota bacterium]